MQQVLNDLAEQLETAPERPAPPAQEQRRLSVWEVTTWVLPMAAEHFRRTLRETPGLPQGTVEADAGPGGTRWFDRDEVALLREEFQSRGRAGRYGPDRSDAPGRRAPVVTLTAPTGAAGRSVVARHLAAEAALAGWRVLLVTAQEGGDVRPTGDDSGDDTGSGPGSGAGLYGSGLGARLAAGAAAALRARNVQLVDRGEAPVAMPAALLAALDETPAAARPGTGAQRWPGLDVLDGAPVDIDPALAGWERLIPGWRAAAALGPALAPWRESHDLILIDPPRGLGPLAMACLAGADVLLVPVPSGGPASQTGLELASGLRGLGRALAAIDGEARARSAALGESGPAAPRQARVVTIPVAMTAEADRGGVVAGLPLFPYLPAGTRDGFHEIDYRALGRLTYAPLRDALHRAWLGFAQQIGKTGIGKTGDR